MSRRPARCWASPASSCWLRSPENGSGTAERMAAEERIVPLLFALLLRPHAALSPPARTRVLWTPRPEWVAVRASAVRVPSPEETGHISKDSAAGPRRRRRRPAHGGARGGRRRWCGRCWRPHARSSGGGRRSDRRARRPRRAP